MFPSSHFSTIWYQTCNISKSWHQKGFRCNRNFEKIAPSVQNRAHNGKQILYSNKMCKFWQNAIHVLNLEWRFYTYVHGAAFPSVFSIAIFKWSLWESGWTEMHEILTLFSDMVTLANGVKMEAFVEWSKFVFTFGFVQFDICIYTYTCICKWTIERDQPVSAEVCLWGSGACPPPPRKLTGCGTY